MSHLIVVWDLKYDVAYVVWVMGRWLKWVDVNGKICKVNVQDVTIMYLVDELMKCFTWLKSFWMCSQILCTSKTYRGPVLVHKSKTYYLIFKTIVQSLPVQQSIMKKLLIICLVPATNSKCSCVGADKQLQYPKVIQNHAHTYNLHPQKAVAPNKYINAKICPSNSTCWTIVLQSDLSVFCLT